MRKVIFAVVACFALAGCKDEGQDFVGQWKNSDKISETVTVIKVDGGYRAVSKLGDVDMSFLDLDVKLVAESSDTLVSADKKSRMLELANDGNLTSYLRNKPKTFTRVN
ncbi:hypothetical protein PS623_04571 [Pseudomonas fluorescens]|uniref:hypothetical protein n=1 Tax=Pseudomonas fluorescens TaxID=294 RepID=UPI0012423AD0|nr:hypothetical protein [Pseudomonas fluorescens]VVN26673.1 hypothetical protein PS623_04571 [Pseudomonas fluorescens]